MNKRTSLSPCTPRFTPRTLGSDAHLPAQQQWFVLKRKGSAYAYKHGVIARANFPSYLATTEVARDPCSCNHARREYICRWQNQTKVFQESRTRDINSSMSGWV